MAEGWAKKLLSDKYDVYSAGIETHGLNPNAVLVMKEAGVDISTQVSTNIDELKDLDLDLVVTVCGHADEHCPTFNETTEVRHHPFDDPPRLAKNAETEEEALEHYRRVRDEIKEFVESLS